MLLAGSGWSSRTLAIEGPQPDANDTTVTRAVFHAHQGLLWPLPIQH